MADDDGVTRASKRARKQSCGRYAKLADSFSTAGHSILTACTQKELLEYFAFGNKQQQIYSFYTEVAAALHSGIKNEFDAICTEKKVKDVLRELELRVSSAAACAAALEEGKCPSLLVAKDAANAKQAEVEELRRVLLQEEEHKCRFAARRDELRRELEAVERVSPPKWSTKVLD